MDSKVLIIGNGDASLYALRRELIQRLLENGYDVDFTVPYGEYVPLLEKMGCVYLPIEYDRLGKDPLNEIKLFWKYRKILKTRQYSVVLLYTIKPTLYAGFICRIYKIPYIVNITGISRLLVAPSLLRDILFYVYRFALKKANVVFFQNKQNLSLFKEKKAVGINAKLIPGSGVNLVANQYEEYIESGSLKILYVGRIIREKGISEWLEAIRILQEENADLIFEFIGEFEENNYKLEITKLHSAGRIRYYGTTKTPHEYMKNAQAVIMPSYHEGLSNVLLEASACGRPILASRVSGCSEILVEGITGFGFEPHSAESIVEAVHKLQSLTYEERKQMGFNGRQHVAKYFSREIVIDEYMREIAGICGGS